MTARRVEDREWEYPPLSDAMEAAVMWPIKEYIQRWQSTIAAQVVFCTIYKMCIGVERMPGSSRMVRWWDQEVGREEE